VVEYPVLRVDGSVLLEPGYDPDTGLLYAPPTPIPLRLPVSPSRDDAERAGRELLEVVEDFPFNGGSGSVGWVASVLTPIAHFAFPGPAPLFFFDANLRACGKSLLADVAGLVVSGRQMDRISPPATDEEMEKRITALALAGAPLALIDNVVHTFGWASLDAALTGRTWNSRILGQSRMTGSLDLAATWYASGNNVALPPRPSQSAAQLAAEETFFGVDIEKAGLGAHDQAGDQVRIGHRLTERESPWLQVLPGRARGSACASPRFGTPTGRAGWVGP